MKRHDVKNIEEAYAYLTDCLLATVAELADRKTKSKRDFDRHVALAQIAIDWVDQFGVPRSGTRSEKIRGSVSAWAKIREIEG